MTTGRHVSWECKCHVVIIPKYRRTVLHGQLHRRDGRILQELCKKRGVVDRRQDDGRPRAGGVDPT